MIDKLVGTTWRDYIPRVLRILIYLKIKLHQAIEKHYTPQQIHYRVQKLNAPSFADAQKSLYK